MLERTNDNEAEDDNAFDGRALSAPFTAKTHRLPVAMTASTRYQELSEDTCKYMKSEYQIP